MMLFDQTKAASPWSSHPAGTAHRCALDIHHPVLIYVCISLSVLQVLPPDYDHPEGWDAQDRERFLAEVAETLPSPAVKDYAISYDRNPKDAKQFLYVICLCLLRLHAHVCDSDKIHEQSSCRIM